MKFEKTVKLLRENKVALFTRAWIEINCGGMDDVDDAVALFTRAWIEISAGMGGQFTSLGRPLHEGVD